MGLSDRISNVQNVVLDKFTAVQDQTGRFVGNKGTE